MTKMKLNIKEKLCKPSGSFGAAGAFALVFALAMLVGGCGREEPVQEAPVSGEPVEVDAVKRRMKDPEYVAKLNARLEGRRQIIAERGEAEAALAKAKAALEAATGDAVKEAEAAVAKAEAALAAVDEKLEKFQKKSLQIVSSQIRGDLDKNKQFTQNKGN